MIQAGMDAILIKVAGIGLTTAHLGKNLVQMEPSLVKLVSTNFILLWDWTTEVDFFRTHCMDHISAAKVASTRV